MKRILFLKIFSISIVSYILIRLGLMIWEEFLHDAFFGIYEFCSAVSYFGAMAFGLGSLYQTCQASKGEKGKRIQHVFANLSLSTLLAFLPILLAIGQSTVWSQVI